MNIKELAEIRYLGVPGNINSCLHDLAIEIQLEHKLIEAKLLTVSSISDVDRHAFLLTKPYEEDVAIRGGFTSGYKGSGPTCLATALQLLRDFRILIKEYEVNSKVLERLNNSCLLRRDLENLELQEDPGRLYVNKYIPMEMRGKVGTHYLRHEFPINIPLGIVDERIFDLAIQFRGDPDSVLLSGYRRLEETVRSRTGLNHDYGERLFSKAFVREDSVLCWGDLHPSEAKGRATLFSGIYMGYRNRRAHKETEDDFEALVREFILLNELFRLESEASERSRDRP